MELDNHCTVLLVILHLRIIIIKNVRKQNISFSKMQ